MYCRNLESVRSEFDAQCGFELKKLFLKCIWHKFSIKKRFAFPKHRVFIENFGFAKK